LSTGAALGEGAGAELLGLEAAVVAVVEVGDSDVVGVELLAAGVAPPPQADSAKTPAEAATTGNNRESCIPLASLVGCSWSVDVPAPWRVGSHPLITHRL
jgi:hypothetical protein